MSPFKDRERNREYQRAWKAGKRAEEKQNDEQANMPEAEGAQPARQSILAFLSGSVANILKDSVDRRRLRKVLYREIITMYEALKETGKDLKKNIDNNTMTWNERYARFKRLWIFKKWIERGYL